PGTTDPAADIGANRHGSGEIEHFDARQGPQRVGGTGIAQLQDHRRIAERSNDRLARRKGCEAGLGTTDGLAVADRHRPHGGLATGQYGGETDIDRLRGPYQSGAAEAAAPAIRGAAKAGCPNTVAP